MISIKNAKTLILAFLIIFKYLCEFYHTLSYINDFIRYETSFSVLNALRRGDLLTIGDIKSVLHQYVEEGSMSQDSINRFFNLKNTNEAIKKMPGITLRLNHNLLDTLLVPTEPFMLEEYVDYYHKTADSKSMEREIVNAGHDLCKIAGVKLIHPIYYFTHFLSLLPVWRRVALPPVL